MRPSSASSDPAFIPTARGNNDSIFKSALVALIKENDSTAKRLRRAETALAEAERQRKVEASKWCPEQALQKIENTSPLLRRHCASK